MKLEKYLAVGKNILEIDIQRKGSIIPVLDIFRQMDSQISKPINDHEKADICYSVVKAISNELTDIAIEFAENQDISTIGITGGVSYNIPIMEMVYERVKQAGKKFIAPNRIPNGDGSISVGQNVLAGHQI